MAETILILGNGFDLAMGRKTSYSDFVEFANTIFESENQEFQNFLNRYPNINIEDYKDNLYIKFINQNKEHLGENWSNLEVVISQIAEAISFFKSHDDFLYFDDGYNLKVDAIEAFRNSMNNREYSTSRMYVAEVFSELYHRNKWAILERSVALTKLNDIFITHLDLLTELLEIYLSYQDYLDFKVNNIQATSTALDAIPSISSSHVLSFNYTHTPERLFDISKSNIHYIHGELDLAREKMAINTMVFGIEDKENTINSDLIPYQKFYQRVVKETGNAYESFFNPNLDIPLVENYQNEMSYSNKNIIIFGHSVDSLDKEIFEKMFNLANSQDSYIFRFIITYYNESVKRSIVKNLAIIIGKDKLIELTGNTRLVFVKSDDVAGMQNVLLR